MKFGTTNIRFVPQNKNKFTYVLFHIQLSCSYHISLQNLFSSSGLWHNLVSSFGLQMYIIPRRLSTSLTIWCQYPPKRSWKF